jgi:nicotinamidase/pyrazinamidase
VNRPGRAIKALVIVDLQNDFVPGGALPVPKGNEITPTVNRLQQLFEVVVATQDWHPPEHGSFAVNHRGKKPGDTVELSGLPQKLWPVHCVQGTPGAQFIPGLDTSRVAKVFQKGTDPDIDSYSGFYDNARRKSTGLEEFLREKNVEEVFVVGLATDFCVKFTTLDSVALGFKTHLIQDACRGLDPKEVKTALKEMEDAGVMLMESK